MYVFGVQSKYLGFSINSCQKHTESTENHGTKWANIENVEREKKMVLNLAERNISMYVIPRKTLDKLYRLEVNILKVHQCQACQVNERRGLPIRQ